MTDRIIFTKKKIEDLPIPEKGRAYSKDAKVPGLILQITAAGTMSFQVFRKAKGKPVRVTLGRYPDLTIEQARRKALTVLSELADGINPNDEKKTKRVQAITLEQVIDDYFDARPGLKATTVKDMRVAFRVMCSDWLKKPIARITRDMIEKRHRVYGEKRSKARANLGMRYLRAVFNFAIDRYTDTAGNPILADNPVAVLKRSWYRVERRRTVIKPHELRPWWTAVEGLDNRCAADYFKVLLLTGLRREEALSLTWENIDFTDRTLTVRDTKNRSDHVLPLTSYLVQILKSRQDESIGEFVFATDRGKFSNLRYALEKVATHSGVKFSPHDIRRTFASIADSLDIPAYALKALLNHKTGSDITAGYIIVTPERLREPMRKITDYVLRAAGVSPTAEVIPFNREMSE